MMRENKPTSSNFKFFQNKLGGENGEIDENQRKIELKPKMQLRRADFGAPYPIGTADELTFKSGLLNMGSLRLRAIISSIEGKSRKKPRNVKLSNGR